jgi:hypothetical protein
MLQRSEGGLWTMAQTLPSPSLLRSHSNHQVGVLCPPLFALGYPSLSLCLLCAHLQAQQFRHQYHKPFILFLSSFSPFLATLSEIEDPFFPPSHSDFFLTPLPLLLSVPVICSPFTYTLPFYFYENHSPKRLSLDPAHSHSTRSPCISPFIHHSTVTAAIVFA